MSTATDSRHLSHEFIEYWIDLGDGDEVAVRTLTTRFAGPPWTRCEVQVLIADRWIDFFANPFLAEHWTHRPADAHVVKFHRMNLRRRRR